MNTVIKQNITKNSSWASQLVILFQIVTEVTMVTPEHNQSNHVTNRQGDFGQPILMEGIPTELKLKISANLLKLLEKQK